MNEHIDTTYFAGVGTILLNRPEVRNALNPKMMAEISSELKILGNERGLKAVVIRGKNGTFSAGADLNWMRSGAAKSLGQNIADNRIIAELMDALYQLPVPLISVTEGAVFGGALGILGCSDWVLAESGSAFAFSEVKLGLAPAIIMPYVLNRSKSIKIRQLMLTGRQFDAWEALDTGLADQVGDAKEITIELKKTLQRFTELPRSSVREVKRLWRLSCPIAAELSEIAIISLAEMKQSPEARELLTNFLNKKR